MHALDTAESSCVVKLDPRRAGVDFVIIGGGCPCVELVMVRWTGVVYWKDVRGDLCEMDGDVLPWESSSALVCHILLLPPIRAAISANTWLLVSFLREISGSKFP